MIKTRFTELVRRRAPDRPGRHAVGRPRRARRGRRQCRRARLHHRADPADAGGPRQGDRALPRDDRQAVRREPHHPAGDQAAALRRISPGHHRGRHQDRRDRRQQAAGTRRRVQEARHQGDPQMHQRSATALSAERMGVDAHLDRRLRMRRPSRRGRHPRPDPDPGRRRQDQDPDDRLRRLRRRPRPGRGAGARRRGHQHGHALHVHQGSADPSDS